MVPEYYQVPFQVKPRQGELSDNIGEYQVTTSASAFSTSSTFQYSGGDHFPDLPQLNCGRDFSYKVCYIPALLAPNLSSCPLYSLQQQKAGCNLYCAKGKEPGTGKGPLLTPTMLVSPGAQGTQTKQQHMSTGASSLGWEAVRMSSFHHPCISFTSSSLGHPGNTGSGTM